MGLLIKLILAHLAGDFLLQPNSWVNAKEERKLKAWQLYVHVLIHGALIMLLVWDLTFWKWALIITGAHFVIDALKVLLQREKTKRFFFFADQALHLISLYVVVCFYTGEIVQLDF